MIASAYWCFWQNGIFENRYSTPSEESITETKMSYTDLVWTSKNSKEGVASRQGTNNGENNIKGRQSKFDMCLNYMLLEKTLPNPKADVSKLVYHDTLVLLISILSFNIS